MVGTHSSRKSAQFRPKRSVSTYLAIVLTSLSASLVSSANTPEGPLSIQESDSVLSLSGKPSIRTEKRWGVFAGLLSEPAPSLWSINGAWNATDFLQLTVGYGQFTHYAMQVHSFHAGAKVLVPTWSLSPYLGFNAGSLTSNSRFVVQGQTINPSGLPVILTVKAGLEWLSPSGFLIGAAYNVAITGPFAGTGSPGIYAGLFF